MSGKIKVVEYSEERIKSSSPRRRTRIEKKQEKYHCEKCKHIEGIIINNEHKELIEKITMSLEESKKFILETQE